MYHICTVHKTLMKDLHLRTFQESWSLKRPLTPYSLYNTASVCEHATLPKQPAPFFPPWDPSPTIPPDLGGEPHREPALSVFSLSQVLPSNPDTAEFSRSSRPGCTLHM